jgi:GNAT superfamily N-acetyltransferase
MPPPPSETNTKTGDNLIIRQGVEEDIPQVLEMITELAVFEKAPSSAVRVSEESMRRNGFGPNAVFKFLIGEVDGVTAAFALYYTAYSTWTGPAFHLEDLYVKERFRSQGIGRQMFNAIMDMYHDSECERLEWIVLDWNTNAINFYKSIGADISSEWLTCQIHKSSIKLASEH